MKKIILAVIVFMLIFGIAYATERVMKFPSGTPVEVATLGDIAISGGEATTVTDSPTIDFTLTGVDITAAVLTVPVVDAASDDTMFLSLFGSATGNLAPMTDAGISYNASTDTLTSGGLTILTTKHLTLGTTQWDNGSDLIDGEQIAADTIDDDSIDFADVTGADLTLTDCGAITASGLITANANIDIKNGASAGILSIYEASGSGTNNATFTVPALSADTDYTLPPDDGDNGEVLKTNGSGVLTWEADNTAAGGFDSTTVDATTWSDGANVSNIWTFDLSGTDITMTFGNGALITLNGGLTLGDALTATGIASSSNNGNATRTLASLYNNDSPDSTEILQTADLVFGLYEKIGAVAAIPHEAAMIRAYKVSDWFHASTEADTDAGLKFFTTNNGTSTEQLSIDNVGLATFTGAITSSSTITSSGTFDVTGAVGMVLGSADVTGLTITTDGTGNAELTLPADSIGDADIDWGTGAGQVSPADCANEDLGDIGIATGVWTVENAAVIGKLITGFSSGAGAVAGTDTILQAINKLDGNVGAKAPIDSPTFTTKVTVPNTAFISGGKFSKSFVITNATADADSSVWRCPVAATITAVHLLCKGGTVTGHLTEQDANGLNDAGVDGATDLTGVTNTNVDDDASLSNPGIDAGDYIGWRTTSITGTNTKTIITFEGYYN
jgi:hypothetical protein